MEFSSSQQISFSLYLMAGKGDHLKVKNLRFLSPRLFERSKNNPAVVSAKDLDGKKKKGREADFLGKNRELQLSGSNSYRLPVPYLLRDVPSSRNSERTKLKYF